MRLERLCAHRRKKYCIQAERCLGGARHAEMAEMGRVERAAKEGYAVAAGDGDTRVAAGLQVHVFIVICDGYSGSASNEVCVT